MTLNKSMTQQQPQTPPPQPTAPNESAGFVVEGFVRIRDLSTQQTLLETRA